MFLGCSSLKKINASGFNTRNVVDMNHTFYGYSSLGELDLHSFHTDNNLSI